MSSAQNDLAALPTFVQSSCDAEVLHPAHLFVLLHCLTTVVTSGTGPVQNLSFAISPLNRTTEGSSNGPGQWEAVRVWKGQNAFAGSTTKYGTFCARVHTERDGIACATAALHGPYTYPADFVSSMNENIE